MINSKKQRLPAIEYIRGISMLGVIAIHVGSQYLMNPSANIHLVALLETVTRFAVPIFFFISAFGLFYNLDINSPFNYKSFMQRRFKTVLIPYLMWSFLYLIHDNLYYNYGVPGLGYIISILFFGLAKYQLYFLVILLWFYALMPLWISIIKNISKSELIKLLILQITFNYFSSYSVILNNFVYSLPADSLLKDFLFFRLNYLILHYVFIFILGGYLAVHFEKFFEFMQKNKFLISCSFFISLIALLSHYYFVIVFKNFSPEAAVNTAHQLSPAGIFYTVTASIFFFTIFTFNNFSEGFRSILSFFGKHSYFAYLFHPFVIFYLKLLLDSSGRIMTAPIAIIFYFATVSASLIAAVIFRNFGDRYSILNKLTIGIYPRKEK